MKRHSLFSARTVALVACLGVPLAASAQPSPSQVSGSAIFNLYCATCHGPAAKGDGPLAAMMTKRPADLTQIAKRNGGSYPTETVARTIDGRSPVKGHGGGDMPVWGDAFGKSTADATPVAEKINRLVAYLETIQVK